MRYEIYYPLPIHGISIKEVAGKGESYEAEE